MMKKDISRMCVRRAVACRMPRAFVLAVALLVASLLSGCAPPPEGADFLAYQFPASRAELRGELNGVEIGALLELAPMPDDGSERDFHLEYTAPDELGGIVITRSGGTVVLSYDGLELPGALFGEFMRPADAFSLTSGVTSAEAEKTASGQTLTHLALEDGSSVTVDSGSGHPVAISVEGLTLRVIWFEPDNR